MYVVPSLIKGKYVIRFTVTSPRTTIEDIVQDWQIIQKLSSEILSNAVEIYDKSCDKSKGNIHKDSKASKGSKNHMVPKEFETVKMNPRYKIKILTQLLYWLMTIVPWFLPLTILMGATINNIDFLCPMV